jgi:hypothetical protein
VDCRTDHKILKVNSILLEEDVSEFPGPVSTSSSEYQLASKLNLYSSRSDTGSILLVLFLFFIGIFMATTSMQANSYFMMRISESRELRCRVRFGTERIQRKRKDRRKHIYFLREVKKIVLN